MGSVVEANIKALRLWKRMGFEVIRQTHEQGRSLCEIAKREKIVEESDRDLGWSVE